MWISNKSLWANEGKHSEKKEYLSIGTVNLFFSLGEVVGLLQYILVPKSPIKEYIVITVTSSFVFRNGFQKLDKIKDSNRQGKQLEELTGKMRECKRYGTWVSIHLIFF